MDEAFFSAPWPHPKGRHSEGPEGMEGTGGWLTEWGPTTIRTDGAPKRPSLLHRPYRAMCHESWGLTGPWRLAASRQGDWGLQSANACPRSLLEACLWPP